MTTLTRADHAAAAPQWVRDLLAGWTGTATVLHSGADAVYLQVERDVLAVLSQRAVHVPCALMTTLTTTGHLTNDRLPPALGTSVPIEHRRLRFAAADVHVGRTISHAAPAIRPERAPLMAARLTAALGPTVDPVYAELPDAGLQALAAADPRAVEALLGLGSGLTPVGDDVVCGWLATVVAAAHPCAVPVGERVLALAGQRTTALSATLLRRAEQGEVVPQFARLVHSLTHRPEVVARAVHDLGGIGHTSGLGLVLGLALALDHLGSRSTCS